MRAIYRLPIKEPIMVEDQWPISVLDGGTFRLRMENGKITYFEIVFNDQPVDHGFLRATDYVEGVKTAVNWRDPRRKEMQKYFGRVLAFLQCDYDIEADVEEIECWYEAETEEEERALVTDLQGLAFGKSTGSEVESVDHASIATALFAAEGEDAPFLTSDLAKMARSAMNRERYIDSFRYSFLLMEFFFGDGQFKAAKLTQAFKSSIQFRSLVENALRDPTLLGGLGSDKVHSKLEELRSIDTVIDYIVDKRGIYFHGNNKRPNAWTSNQQQEAEVICRLSMAIVRGMSSDELTSVMYSNQNWARYETNASAEGVMLRTSIRFRVYDRGDKLNKTYNTEHDFVAATTSPKHSVNIAIEALNFFLERFSNVDLRSASASVKDAGKELFELNIEAASREGDIAKSENRDVRRPALQLAYEFYNSVDDRDTGNITELEMDQELVTPRDATQLALKFLIDFRRLYRDHDLRSVDCTWKATGVRVFNISVFAKSGSIV